MAASRWVLVISSYFHRRIRVELGELPMDKKTADFEQRALCRDGYNLFGVSDDGSSRMLWVVPRLGSRMTRGVGEGSHELG